MIVKCIAHLGKNLSPNALKVTGFVTTDFQLEPGKINIVYSISLFKGILQYLTFDRWNTLPFWFPAELFLIESSSLPENWYFKYFNPPTPGGLEALWGFEEIVNDPEYYDNLILRESKSVQIFLDRKGEIDRLSVK